MPHKLSPDMIEESWSEIVEYASSKPNFFGTDYVKCIPNITFDNELNFEEDSLKLFFTPGHTKDSISIFDKVEKAL